MIAEQIRALEENTAVASSAQGTHVVCGGYGYPLGNASAARITTVGKALQRSGVSFSLLHCGPSPDPVNTKRSGVYQGIPFEYTTSVKRPTNLTARLLVYTRALIGLTLRLARLRPRRHRTLVYLYVGDGVLNFYTGSLCRLLGFRLVQELCEWAPGDSNCSAFTRWLYRKPIFKQATGALVISKEIEHRVKARSAEVNPDLLILRLPSIVDAKRFATSSAGDDVQIVNHFVYCGTWLKDVFFIVRVFAMVRSQGYDCKLRIVGGWTESSKLEILAYAGENNLSAGDIVMTGCVDERGLEACYRTAAALLTPLWNDDRSKTRLPNKLGEYLASGRPVVAGRVGDLTEFLVDDVNACLAEPGDERDFADRMMYVLRNPKRAHQIGAAGQQASLAHLDYRAHSNRLSKFFVECLEYKR